MRYMLVILCLCVTAVHADNFGHESVGGFNIDVEDYIAGAWFDCPSDGTADSIYAYLKITGGTHNVEVAIYQWEDGDDTALVDNSSTKAVAISEGWTGFALSGASLTGGTTYLLAVWSNAVGGVAEADMDIGGGNGQAGKAQTFDGWPNPLSKDAHWNGRNMSIYCVYTPTAAGQVIIINTE